MSITKSVVESIYAAAAATFSGAVREIRYNTKDLTGIGIPITTAELVDDAGAIRAVEGALRIKVSEFGQTWPKINERISVRSRETGQWVDRIVVSTVVDEMGATMLLQYGEEVDERY